jgi:hypothetical protein
MWSINILQKRNYTIVCGAKWIWNLFYFFSLSLFSSALCTHEVYFEGWNVECHECHLRGSKYWKKFFFPSPSTWNDPLLCHMNMNIKKLDVYSTAKNLFVSKTKHFIFYHNFYPHPIVFPSLFINTRIYDIHFISLFFYFVFFLLYWRELKNHSSKRHTGKYLSTFIETPKLFEWFSHDIRKQQKKFSIKNERVFNWESEKRIFLEIYTCI